MSTRIDIPRTATTFFSQSSSLVSTLTSSVSSSSSLSLEQSSSFATSTFAPTSATSLSTTTSSSSAVLQSLLTLSMTTTTTVDSTFLSSTGTLTSSTSSTSPLPSPPPLPPVQEQIYDSWGIFILVALLFVTLVVAYFLKARRIRSVHETVVSVILGLVVGLVIRLSPGDEIQQVVTFDHRIFFTVLLPPIILESGYGMNVKQFFSNLGSIMTFAFLGTLTSTMFCGLLIYLFALTGIHSLHMSFMDCFTFGAILSSTDPVTVLAIFKQVGVDPKLYAIVFGESVLNDSVAIVLFSTLDHFKNRTFSVSALFEGSGLFLGVFMGSLFTGITFALTCSLLLKHTRLYQFPALESCIVTLMAYGSYLLANGLKLSGIVSLLFCGIMLKHYAYGNLSKKSRRTTRYMFGVLAQLSENFVFVYLGIAVCTVTDGKYAWGLIAFTAVVLLVARYVSVIPCSHLINWVTKRLIKNDRNRGQPGLQAKVQIPHNYQMMIWWAGLRGAISFALSYEVDSPESGPVIRTTTLIVCVLSILVLGGTCVRALEHYKIRIGVGKTGDSMADDGIEGHSSDEENEEDDGDDDADGPETHQGGHQGSPMETRPSSDSFDEEGALLGGGGIGRAGIRYPSNSVAEASNWFVSFDDKWLKPFFTRDGGRLGWGHVDGLLNDNDFDVGSRRTGRVQADRRNSHGGSGDRVSSRNGGSRVTVSVEPSVVTAPKNKSRLFGLVRQAYDELAGEDFMDVNGKAVTDSSTRRSTSVTRQGRDSLDGYSSRGELILGRGTRPGSHGALNVPTGGTRKLMQGQGTGRTSFEGGGASTVGSHNSSEGGNGIGGFLASSVSQPSKSMSSRIRPGLTPSARRLGTSEPKPPLLNTVGGSASRGPASPVPMDVSSEADEWGELVTAPTRTSRDMFGWQDGYT
ncbi:monovalent cation:H+ antiporter, CPA1 (nhx1) [Gonapodya sp. JEL0774]|nr:monovalent cation:H+ antiporter, CPA1 (nhx1) [Gonapodya sp. JEL0774]